MTTTEIRVVGGWVRDKLLTGKSNSDIDLTVDNVTGFEFATKIHNYWNEKSLSTTSASTSSISTTTSSMLSISSTKCVNLIKANPAQSKHLETATFKIGDLSIDVAQLRSETYNNQSRIPNDVKIGTPKQDAFRRDLTINSLFYNLRTCKVEDHTGFGLSDLAQGLVRTPLSPRETFNDDPLRVLRSIRFAARLEFKLHSDLVAAACSQNTHHQLRTKVTRERIGMEIQKIIRETYIENIERVQRAFQMLCEFGLHTIVFWHDNSCDASHALLKTKGLARLRSIAADCDSREMKLSLVLAVFLSSIQDNKPMLSVALKLSTKITQEITNIITAAHQLRDLVSSWSSSIIIVSEATATTAGRIVHSVGPAIVVVLELTRILVDEQHSSPLMEQFCTFRAWLEKDSALLHNDSYGPCWTWKALVNGTVLNSQYKLVGSDIGYMLQRIMDWRFTHPLATVTECHAFLTSLLIPKK